MTPSYALALAAARDAAGAQHYPQGTLYLVATPIGNLADISLRALHVLTLADTIACEDTRHTRTLLQAYGIEKPGSALLALHQHNERAGASLVVDRLRLGQRVAYVSDAGTPAVSDPGAGLVAAVRDAALTVVPVPGASSVTTALSVAGLPQSDGVDGGFVFAGFLPAKAAERVARIALLAAEIRAVVLLEAPHRIEALARALSGLGERRITVAREITKQFEEIATLTAAELAPWLAANPNRSRGEFVLVLHPQAVAAQSNDDVRILKLLLAELPLKTAVKLAAEISGSARNDLYTQALQLRDASTSPD